VAVVSKDSVSTPLLNWGSVMSSHSHHHTYRLWVGFVPTPHPVRGDCYLHSHTVCAWQANSVSANFTGVAEWHLRVTHQLLDQLDGYDTHRGPSMTRARCCMCSAF